MIKEELVKQQKEAESYQEESSEEENDQKVVPFMPKPKGADQIEVQSFDSDEDWVWIILFIIKNFIDGIRSSRRRPTKADFQRKGDSDLLH